MKAFLFGAGSSCGTVGAPTSANFGSELGCLDPDWPIHYPAIRKVVKHLDLSPDKWGLEEVWSCIDFSSKLQEAIPDALVGPCYSPELKKALLKIYGTRLDVLADGLPISADYTLGSLFTNEVVAGDVLVSFNYDTVVERVAIRFGQSLRAPGMADLGSHVTTVKPHGSTSWTMDRSSGSTDWCTASGDPRLVSLTPRDIDCGREPLVLGTVPMKSELIQEVQDAGGFPSISRTIARQWRAVVEAVREADSMIAVGYSFPKEDHYVRFLIEEGLRRRKGPPKVEFYELPKSACKVKREIMNIMTRVYGPHVSSPVFRGPVTRPIDT
jgi:hypothetical protein